MQSTSREAASVKAKPRSDEAALVKGMLQLARTRPRFGERRIGGLLVLGGPEFIANEPRAWLDRVGVSTLSIKPGSPRENGFAESVQSRFRDECLAQEIFDGLHDAKAITAAWKDNCNHRRPHGPLGFQTPAGFAAACAASASAKASAPAADATVCLGF